MSPPGARTSTNPTELLAQIKDKKLPPVHKWNPELCGDMDMRIGRDGTWYYMGSPIGRQPLVRLFSTILRRDPDNEYYLVTPAEKLRIRVDDAPFVAVELDISGDGENQRLIMRTNVDDAVLVDEAHPLTLRYRQSNGEPAPYVVVRDRLEALISRSVYYQLVELGDEREFEGKMQYGVWSARKFFVLGEL